MLLGSQCSNMFETYPHRWSKWHCLQYCPSLTLKTCCTGCCGSSVITIYCGSLPLAAHVRPVPSPFIQRVLNVLNHTIPVFRASSQLGSANGLLPRCYMSCAPGSTSPSSKDHSLACLLNRHTLWSSWLSLGKPNSHCQLRSHYTEESNRSEFSKNSWSSPRGSGMCPSSMSFVIGCCEGMSGLMMLNISYCGIHVSFCVSDTPVC